MRVGRARAELLVHVGDAGRDVQEKPRGAYTPNVVLEVVPPCVDPPLPGMLNKLL